MNLIFHSLYLYYVIPRTKDSKRSSPALIKLAGCFHKKRMCESILVDAYSKTTIFFLCFKAWQNDGFTREGRGNFFWANIHTCSYSFIFENRLKMFFCKRHLYQNSWNEWSTECQSNLCGSVLLPCSIVVSFLASRLDDDGTDNEYERLFWILDQPHRFVTSFHRFVLSFHRFVTSFHRFVTSF